jgi:hypothetical protein
MKLPYKCTLNNESSAIQALVANRAAFIRNGSFFLQVVLVTQIATGVCAAAPEKDCP